MQGPCRPFLLSQERQASGFDYIRMLCPQDHFDILRHLYGFTRQVLDHAGTQTGEGLEAWLGAKHSRRWVLYLAHHQAGLHASSLTFPSAASKAQHGCLLMASRGPPLAASALVTWEAGGNHINLLNCTHDVAPALPPFGVGTRR